MATRKTTASASAKTVKKVEPVTIESNEIEEASYIEEPKKELSMDEKITIRNLASWMVGFNKIESIGQVNIDGGGVSRISRGEVVAQAENGNRLIAGLDGEGSHATIFIEDKATREYLGYEGNGKSQKVVSTALLEDIFNEGSEDVYRERMSDLIQTRCEREAVKKLIADNNLEDNISYSRIKFVKDLCRMNF